MIRALLCLSVFFFAHTGQAAFDLQLSCGENASEVKMDLVEDQLTKNTQTVVVSSVIGKENETSETLLKKLVQEASKSVPLFESCAHFFLNAGAYECAFTFFCSCHANSSFEVYAKTCELFQIVLKGLETKIHQRGMRALYAKTITYCQTHLSAAEHDYRKALYNYNQGLFQEAILSLSHITSATYGAVYYKKFLCVLMNCYSGLKDIGHTLHLADRLLSYSTLSPQIRARALYLRLKYYKHTADSLDNCFHAAFTHAQSHEDFAALYSLMKEQSHWIKALGCIERMIQLKQNPQTAQNIEGYTLFELYCAYCAGLMRIICYPYHEVTFDQLMDIQSCFHSHFAHAQFHARTDADNALLAKIYASFEELTLPQVE